MGVARGGGLDPPPSSRVGEIFRVSLRSSEVAKRKNFAPGGAFLQEDRKNFLLPPGAREK